MPILDLQRRLHEAGRIRIGRQVEITGGRAGRTRPERLDHFRFTSPSRRALDAVAALHGGDVTPWKGAPVGEQWELFTPATEIPVIVPPDVMGFSQSYEVWSAGGCKRRCDGVTESISDGPCLCDAEARECKPHTRISVMLVGIQGVGLWRLDTQGWYAAAELQGAHGIAQLLAASLGRSILPARLRVEARTVKRIDPKTETASTRNFVVPVLDFDVDVAAVALAGVPTVNAPALAAAAITPIPALLPPSLAEQLEAVDEQTPAPRRRNSPPSLPRTGVAPRPVNAVPTEAATQVESEAPSGQPAEPSAPAPLPVDPPAAALRKVFALFKDLAIKDRDDRLAICSLIIKRGIASSNDLTSHDIDDIVEVLQMHFDGSIVLVKRDGMWKLEDAPA